MFRTVNSEAVRNSTLSLKTAALSWACREGSYAHEYAAEHSIPVRLISTGDVNRDYTVNIDDATEIQKSLAEIILFDDEQTALADVDGDGEVSISDATAVQFMIAR